ncbi:hypothetical protein GCM10023224_05190 [Streptomonospora halophila]|uniref:Helix-turn-helix domain-containing protein n=1 Tax=Streptomonospora halophila TaxID=427369 RepID=A0ABP9G4W8_9ACTN
MARGQRITDDTRTAIINDIRNGGTCRGIARDHGVSPASVANIAKEADLTDAFERTATERATRAKQADNRARRAQLASDLLNDAARLREQLWEATTIGAFGGREGDWHEAQVPEPPFTDKRAILAGVQTAVRSHVELEKVDTGSGAEAAASMLSKLAVGLKQAWEDGDAGLAADEPQAGPEHRDE